MESVMTLDEVMKYYKCYTMPELAEKLEIPVGTIRAWSYRNYIAYSFQKKIQENTNGKLVAVKVKKPIKKKDLKEAP